MPTPTLSRESSPRLPAYFLLGLGFGIVLTKAEIVSWFQIHEMFLFRSFRMYAIIASALAVAGFSLAALRRFGVRSLDGERIDLPPKAMEGGYRYAIGGTIFGVGWALTGACPGPLFALIGSGATVVSVALASALAGTWVYGLLRASLPH